MIERDSDRHIDFAFELTRRFDRDVQMHVDETDERIGLAKPGEEKVLFQLLVVVLDEGADDSGRF